MSNYIVTTDFAVKDTYTVGDPRKVAKGADVATEFDNIATAITTKQDSAASGVANGYCPLNGSALVTKTFQWTTTAYTDAANAFTAAQSVTTNAASGHLLTLTDSYTGAGVIGQLVVSGQNNTNGAAILMQGNGSTTPNKYMFVQNGIWGIATSSYTNIMTLTDAGVLTAASFVGSVAGSSITGTIPTAAVTSGAVTQYESSLSIGLSQVTGTANVYKNSGSLGSANITFSTASPSGGSNGDIWFQY